MKRKRFILISLLIILILLLIRHVHLTRKCRWENSHFEPNQNGAEVNKMYYPTIQILLYGHLILPGITLLW